MSWVGSVVFAQYSDALVACLLATSSPPRHSRQVVHYATAPTQLPLPLLSCTYLLPPSPSQALLRVLTREDFGGDSMAELVASRYASPFLQAALRAAATLPHSRCVMAGFFVHHNHTSAQANQRAVCACLQDGGMSVHSLCIWYADPCTT
jgi:hypothetical protein